jgi:DNA-binding response OmpR family regulator
MKGRILVVEDDPSILRGLQLNLAMEGYTVRSAMDGETGLALARSEHPDLLLVDVMLPRMGGLELIRAVRADDPATPILVLSAKGQEADKVAGLELGADDYVVKPFSLKELLARIAAALRRGRTRPPDAERRHRFGSAEVDLVGRRLTVRGAIVPLTAREFDLLAFFVAHPGRVYSREQLLDNVWGYQHSGYDHTVNSHINRLRAKIEQDPQNPEYILTVWGVGYKFNEASEQPSHRPG